MNNAYHIPIWYPRLPGGWKLTRVKAAFASFDSGVWGEDPFDEESSTPVIRSNEIDEDGNWRVSSPALRLLSPQEKEKTLLIEGDLLIVKSSGSHIHIGKTAVVTKEIENLKCCFSNFTGRIRLIQYLTNSRFLWYYLNNSPGRDQLFYQGTTTTGLINLSAVKIGIGLIALPPLIEQEHIARYLDLSCAAVDAAVEAKRKQIETLEKLRQSTIQRAVTQGLSKSEDLVDSHSQIVPTIPSGWKIKRLKTIADIRYGLGQPPSENKDGVAMIRATNVNAGTISEKDLLYVEQDELPLDRNPYLKEDEIIVVRSGAYTGDSAIIPQKYVGAVAGYDMVVTVTHAEPKFIAYGLLSNYVLQGQILLLTLRAAQPHLNAEELGSIIFALPPTREEQQAIVAFLEGRLAEIEAIADCIENQIETLVDYRKSLVHECVTGKRRITEEDVREIEKRVSKVTTEMVEEDSHA